MKHNVGKTTKLLLLKTYSIRMHMHDNG